MLIFTVSVTEGNDGGSFKMSNIALSPNLLTFMWKYFPSDFPICMEIASVYSVFL